MRKIEFSKRNRIGLGRFGGVEWDIIKDSVQQVSTSELPLYPQIREPNKLPRVGTGEKPMPALKTPQFGNAVTVFEAGYPSTACERAGLMAAFADLLACASR